MLLLLLCAILCSSFIAAAPPAACTNSSEIRIAGTCSWASGVNLPWNDYGRDFGTNAWGHDGVSVTSATITPYFTSIHGYHARVVRWWLFSDLRAGVTFDGSGTPTGLDSFVFPDMDAMLAIAAKQNTYVVLSLFDFIMANTIQVVNGVQTGGRANLISVSTMRAALLKNVIAPILSRYGTNANILAWEIMNEPEWAVAGLPQNTIDPSKVDAIPRAAFWDFCNSVINLVHSSTNQQVTIGSASLKWYRIWTPAYSAQYGLPSLNFDFYQTHYYSWMDPYCITNDPDLGTVCMNPLHQKLSGLVLGGKAMVIGELALTTNATGILSQLLNLGYSGAWPWAYTQASSGYPIDWTTFTTWTTAHQSIIHWS